MKHYFNQPAKWFCMVLALLFSFGLKAQEADNEFSLDAKLNTRGEIRVGGFDADLEDENQRKACFVMGQYRINLGYKRSDWLEIRLSPQFSGIWGQAGGTLSLSEGWLSMKHNKTGLFTKIGRQCFEYDDERILGYDDWTMTAPTHDALKFGFEGYGHKVHVLLAYNQNAENISTGGNYYSDGIQPYKTMQTLWYHYNTPKNLFGISLIGMNIGMQSKNDSKPSETYYQQLVGTYVTLKPGIVALEGAFYYQMGKEEHGMTLDAYMGSAKVTVSPSEKYNLYAGYDYMSGEQFPIAINGGLGLIFHDKARGFSTLFGSHHEFYGAMDFFYLDSYVHNFSPGLQNLYVGGNVSPVTGLKINAAYHFYAIAADLQIHTEKLNKALCHEMELNVGYTFAKFATVSAGYTFMRGTETMQTLQNLTDNRRLHWGWVMLSVKPTLFSTLWQDKKH